MAEEELEYRVEYLDEADEATEPKNWLARPGKARVTYAGGAVFEGSFDSERLKNGDGKYTWHKIPEEGEDPVPIATYEGTYKDGRRHGVGKMTYPNGDTYQGEWVDGNPGGTGTYVYKSTGDVYSGQWQAGMKEGTGMYQFGADESTLHGQWASGSITSGKWVFKDETVYTGTFSGGRPTGPGSFAFTNGILQRGEYSAVLPKDAEEDSEEPPELKWVGKSVYAC